MAEKKSLLHSKRGAVSPKTGAAERRLGSRKPPVGLMFRLIPAIDQTHLSFQRGQEAWLADAPGFYAAFPWGGDSPWGLVRSIRAGGDTFVGHSHSDLLHCYFRRQSCKKIFEKKNWFRSRVRFPPTLRPIYDFLIGDPNIILFVFSC
jgi:hypothetical protein